LSKWPFPISSCATGRNLFLSTTSIRTGTKLTTTAILSPVSAPPFASYEFCCTAAVSWLAPSEFARPFFRCRFLSGSALSRHCGGPESACRVKWSYSNLTRLGSRRSLSLKTEMTFNSAPV
jgi:hypothetical protein